MINTPILVVDDDPTFLRIIGNALKQQNIDTLLAESPEAARELYLSQPIEYAILDLNIDGQSGLQVLQDLLLHQAQCRALILTGYASITTAVEAMRLGAIDYLCKPASVQDILKKLQTLEPATKQEKETENRPVNPSEDDFQAMSVRRMEWEHIQKVLAENDGNISATAKALNMHRRTLQRKLQKRPVQQ
ncbi:DNA-binding response regulator [Thiosulfatimonas sediminis]|uniref:DNA-binding response regulator n=1 Tax=Thiosulfatimonas sediminis TaxID=2675054 RepID=A0A6F8PT85_9GAMM|nr:response regulator [Thiosulfatimonas sediminis]BBP45352.1 DNA-binding response regulator [Thiosulfatimonas sediminis]